MGLQRHADIQAHRPALGNPVSSFCHFLLLDKSPAPPYFPRMVHPRAFLFLLLALLATLGSASAQLDVGMTFKKKRFLAYEVIEATVTVHNRAGKDLILGGPGGASWLTFDVSKDELPVLPIGNGVSMQNRLLPAGRSLQHRVNLNSVYPLGGLGNYAVAAKVYFADLETYASSAPQMLMITEGNKVWEETVGLATGRQGPGSVVYRNFTLLSFIESDKMSLYIRLRDQASQRVIACYPLGRLAPFRDLQPVLDAQNNLHVLFMAGRNSFIHSTISPSGEPVASKTYQDENGVMPQLMIAGDRSVRVRGGIEFDPLAPKPQDALVIHNLSDRPAGLPTGPASE
jgi:hypothetical protein